MRTKTIDSRGRWLATLLVAAGLVALLVAVPALSGSVLAEVIQPG